MSVTRLFDLLENYHEKYPENKVTLAGKVNHKWVKYNISEYIDYANKISYAFMEKGVKPGENIGIISANRPEWNFFDMGIMQMGAISIPIYPNMSKADYKHIISKAEIKYLFIDTAFLVKKIKPITDEIPGFKEIICLEKAESTTIASDFYKLGEENPKPDELKNIQNSINPDDVATMIFTSGTTGLSKGVMLSHRNIIFQLEQLQETPAKWSKVALSFLPLCHAYERMIVYLYHYLGFSIYYAENLGTIAENIKEVHPTMMTCVPRVLEKMYDKLYAAGKKLTGFSKTLYYWAFNLAKEYKIYENTSWYLFKHKIADKLIYSKWRAAIGGNFDIVVSGGAAIQKDQVAFFNAIGMPCFEGYGLSETSPVIAVSYRGKNRRRAGTVGIPLPGMQVKLGENDEIICKGQSVMKGYYKEPELTAEVIDKDGWFHTGDIGKFDKDGLLSVTGRLKHIFKTSLGKYINPFIIEEEFSKSPFIEYIVIVGENQKFPAAIITPDMSYLKEYCRKNNIEIFPDRNKFLNSKKIQDIYKNVINKNNIALASYEKVKRFRLVADEWNIDNGILTPTLKVKRNAISKKYKDLIEEIYK